MDNLQKEFSRIYDQQISKIFRFVFLKVNSQEIAQDITSETFSRAWQKFQNQTAGSRVGNWTAFLYQIARNLVTDFYRSKGKIEIVSAAAVADPPADIDLTQSAILSSDVEQVRSVLAKLGEEQQEVLIWRYLDGLSFKEISQILGKPEGTVRVISHRALEALRGQLNN